MDTQAVLISLVGGLVAGAIVGFGLTEVLKGVVDLSGFVGMFVGLMAGVVVFATLYLFNTDEEHDLGDPAKGPT